MRNEEWDNCDGMFDKTYYLYECGEEIDSVIDTCIENALEYFRDNYEGDYIIECPEDGIKISL